MSIQQVVKDYGTILTVVVASLFTLYHNTQQNTKSMEEIVQRLDRNQDSILENRERLQANASDVRVLQIQFGTLVRDVEKKETQLVNEDTKQWNKIFELTRSDQDTRTQLTLVKEQISNLAREYAK